MTRPVPARLFYLSASPSRWRKAALLLHKTNARLAPDIRLEVRDHLPAFGLPREAWIDFRILADWIRRDVPLPLAAILGFAVRNQTPEGAWLVDGAPNSGACYRSLELLAHLGWDAREDTVRRGIHYLVERLQQGGLASPAPLAGMPLEVGTTARFLHVLHGIAHLPEEARKAKHEMRAWLLARAHTFGETEPLCCWHTDEAPTCAEAGIVGATSLALYALLRTWDLGPDPRMPTVIAGAVRWLVAAQNAEGGWGDRWRANPNIDNTFNAVRALMAFLDRGAEDEALRADVHKALAKAKTYVLQDTHLAGAAERENPSGLAMCLRARLLFCGQGRDALRDLNPWHKAVLDALDAIADTHEAWFHPQAHYYNAILIVGLALAEWRHKVVEHGKRVYALARNSRGLRFLLDFPIRLPPLFPGARESLYDRLLDALVAARLHPVAFWLERAITFREIGSMLASIVLLASVYANQDLVQAVAVPGGGWGFLIPIAALYALWLIWKWRHRRSTPAFFSTLVMAWLAAWGLITWLGAAWQAAFLHAAPAPEFWRVLLFFALLADAGSRMVREFRLERFLAREQDE